MTLKQSKSEDVSHMRILGQEHAGARDDTSKDPEAEMSFMCLINAARKFVWPNGIK